jgi:hypothetical protein
MYVTSTTLQGTMNLNPPHVILLMSPLGALRLSTAAYAMWGITLGAAIGFAFAVFRNFDRTLGWIVLTVILVSSASTVAVSLINVAWPLAAVTAWAYTWYRTGYVRRAVIALGCIATVKLFYLVFVPYWFWRKDWNALKWFAAALTSVFLGGVFALGWKPYVTWFMALRHGSPLSDTRPLDASWHSIVTRLLDGGIFAQWAWILGVAFVITGTWFALRRSSQSVADWGVLLTAMLVISPLGWVYYVLIPSVPVVAVLLERRQVIALRLIATAFAVPPVAVVLTADKMSSALASAVINSFYGITLLFVWCVLVTGLRYSTSQGSATR